jgi:TAG lipase/steryl ester hydrolase/phospholipase A2/LPA acyltransferase
MSMLGDSTIVPSKCHKRDSDSPVSLPVTPNRSLRKAISIPAVSSIVKESWNWAGETLHNYRDGHSAEERRQKAEIEDRKQVLYLKIKNVSQNEGGWPCPWRAVASAE